MSGGGGGCSASVPQRAVEADGFAERRRGGTRIERGRVRCGATTPRHQEQLGAAAALAVSAVWLWRSGRRELATTGAQQAEGRVCGECNVT